LRRLAAVEEINTPFFICERSIAFRRAPLVGPRFPRVSRPWRWATTTPTAALNGAAVAGTQASVEEEV